MLVFRGVIPKHICFRIYHQQYDWGFAKTLVHRDQIIFSNLCKGTRFGTRTRSTGFPVLRQGPEVWYEIFCKNPPFFLSHADINSEKHIHKTGLLGKKWNVKKNTSKHILRYLLLGGNSNICHFHPYVFGEDEPILTSIFFKGVGSTTNQ